MKKPLVILTLIALALSVLGAVIMQDGRKTAVKKADLSEERVELSETRKADLDKPTGPASVFDEVIDGNLVIWDGDKLKDHTSAEKPTKYYVFYYTASWCGPCRAFTPKLVDFYNNHKSENFELVQISADRNEKAMHDYIQKNKMPWLNLTFDQVKAFRSKFKHGVRGIPAVIVCDLEGNIVSSKGRNLVALEQLVK